MAIFIFHFLLSIDGHFSFGPISICSFLSLQEIIIFLSP